MQKLLHKTLAEIVTAEPKHAQVFEKFGLDYCCGGNVSLETSCKNKSLDVSAVLKALTENEPATHSPKDWPNLSISELVNHILHTHHSYLKSRMPYTSELIEKVIKVHASKHPELLDIRNCYLGFPTEMEQHLAKEENILFPMLQELDSGSNAPYLSHIANPISVMEAEHDQAGEYLATLRKLTNNFQVPKDGCNTYKILYSEFLKLEQDTHMHIHKENNILFLKALDYINTKKFKA